MIPLGELKDSKLAQQVIAELAKHQISASLKELDGVYVVLIEREADIPRAVEIYRVLLHLPAPPKPLPEEWSKIKRLPMGQLTLNLVLLCIAIYTIPIFSGNRDWWQWLFIAPEGSGHEQAWELLKHGQWWRLWTPIFLHFNFIHLLFNLLWLKDLGSLIEYTRGRLFLVLLILVLGAGSNLAQFWIHGPMFGGMSGVVYGFLGYVWMLKTCYPLEEYAIPRSDMLLMIAWFFLCLTGWLGPIANTAHGVGLGLGMVWGMIQGLAKNAEPGTRPRGFKLVGFLVFALAISLGTMAFEFYF